MGLTHYQLVSSLCTNKKLYQFLYLTLSNIQIVYSQSMYVHFSENIYIIIHTTMMDEIECLVALGERKKLIQCNKSQFLQKIAELFNIVDAFELQTFNSDYEDWIETSVESIENKTKIKVVLLPTIIDVSTTIVDNPTAGIEPDIPNNTNNLKTLPRPYRLPKFTPDLEASMIHVDSVTATTRRRVVQALFEDIIQYTMYPNSREYNDVCALLIYKYPKLSDKSISMHINARPYESWLRSLITKFKSERQKIKSHDVVEEMRRKHSSVHKAVNNTNAITIEKKNRLQFSVMPFEGENEETMPNHIEDIRIQCLNDCMTAA
ncbi:hypothetical protein FQR65_LT13528 [Abscondita terminalis]|nr:hypothetical protein FQR65_LT13528 [Abscondita terminalis]